MSDGLVQLGLDGRHTSYPMPKVHPLSEAQRAVLLHMRTFGDVRPIQVGEIMHARRDHPSPKYYSSDGADALARLARRGLVCRVRRGCWRLVTHDEENWW